MSVAISRKGSAFELAGGEEAGFAGAEGASAEGAWRTKAGSYHARGLGVGGAGVLPGGVDVAFEELALAI